MFKKRISLIVSYVIKMSASLLCLCLSGNCLHICFPKRTPNNQTPYMLHSSQLCSHSVALVSRKDVKEFPVVACARCRLCVCVFYISTVSHRCQAQTISQRTDVKEEGGPIRLLREILLSWGSLQLFLPSLPPPPTSSHSHIIHPSSTCPPPSFLLESTYCQRCKSRCWNQKKKKSAQSEGVRMRSLSSQRPLFLTPWRKKPCNPSAFQQAQKSPSEGGGKLWNVLPGFSMETGPQIQIHFSLSPCLRDTLCIV